MIRIVLAALPAALLAVPALAESQGDAPGGRSPVARAEIAGRDGGGMGHVDIAETASGQLLLTLALTGIPEGVHGVHIHETGDCSAEDFSSAGGHLSGDAEHGVGAPGGPHPGDLPNATAGADQRIDAEYFSDRLTPEMMFDDDGAAFIVHSGPDDYATQPAGAAGDRIACGVFEDLRR